MHESSHSQPLPPYLWMVLVALAIRLAIIPFLYHEWLDPFVLEHWAFGRVARSIASGHGFGSPFADTGATALLPPVYPYILASIFKVFGIYTKTSIVAALALNSVFSALTCIPAFFVARKSFGQRAAKWAGWGWALSPYGIYYGADWAWSTCLVTLLLCVLFLIAFELESSTRTRSWLGFGLLCGFAALTEPVVLSVVPLLGGWSCYRLYRRGERWFVPGAVAALAFVAVMSPWIVRNYRIFQRLIPVRSGFGLELYLGNNGYSGSWVTRSVHPNHSDAELAEYERVGELAYMEHKQQQAMSYIRSHPGWFVWMTMRRVLYMWTGFWSFDRAYLKEEPLDPPNIILSTVLTVLAVMGLRRAFRTDVRVAVRYAIVLLFFPLVYYISHPETYYFRPVDPIIVVLGAYAVSACLDSKNTHQEHTIARSQRV
ncbi:MAG TPA: glycosyltransferase family 39 protein [Terriglobales bacterium]|nr:glycosyltransferase family 39 protein [Terriglobales bacterium]